MIIFFYSMMYEKGRENIMIEFKYDTQLLIEGKISMKIRFMIIL